MTCISPIIFDIMYWHTLSTQKYVFLALLVKNLDSQHSTILPQINCAYIIQVIGNLAQKSNCSRLLDWEEVHLVVLVKDDLFET
jgi:hypothetical protein